MDIDYSYQDVKYCKGVLKELYDYFSEVNSKTNYIATSEFMNLFHGAVETVAQIKNVTDTPFYKKHSRIIDDIYTFMTD